jgi:hypothetical protein
MIAGTSAWTASAAAKALFAIRPHGGMNVALCGLSDMCTAGNLEPGLPRSASGARQCGRHLARERVPHDEFGRTARARVGEQSNKP